MALQMMSKINPMFFNQCLKFLEEENDKKKKKKSIIKNINIIIPEYETIDTETNPLNKYIENAINISYIMKLEILKEQYLNPNKFVDFIEVLSSPGLLPSPQLSSQDYKHLLCLIGNI